MAAMYRNLAIVAAYGEGNRVIGKNGRLPWQKLQADMARFVELTRGRRLFVTRPTFHPLRKVITRYGRIPVVLTRDREYSHPRAVTVNDYETLGAYMRGPSGGMAIGGPTLFAFALPYAELMHLTVVHGCFDGDAFFPDFNPVEWRLVREKDHPANDENLYPLTFQTFKRRRFP